MSSVHQMMGLNGKERQLLRAIQIVTIPNPLIIQLLPRLCDAQFNDCEYPLNSNYRNPNNTYQSHSDGCMCPSDDYTADIDNDGISDCRDADGLECTPDPTASCDGGIYAGVVGECVCNDGCSDCVDDLGNECTPPEGSVCVPELSGNGLTVGSDTYTHVAAVSALNLTVA